MADSPLAHSAEDTSEADRAVAAVINFFANMSDAVVEAAEAVEAEAADEATAETADETDSSDGGDEDDADEDDELDAAIEALIEPPPTAADLRFRELMSSGTFADYLARVGEERCDNFDEPVSLYEMRHLQEAIQHSSRPFSSLATFVPKGWKRMALSEPGVNVRDGKANQLDLLHAAKNFELTVDGHSVHLIAAGGAVQYQLYHNMGAIDTLYRTYYPNSKTYPHDTDYFLVANSEEDYCYFNNASHDVMSRLAKKVYTLMRTNEPRTHNGSYSENDWTVSICRGVMTFMANNWSAVKYKVQVILRGPYRTDGAAVSGFDLPTCSVYAKIQESAIPKFFATTEGAYAAATSVQIVDLERRSTTFAKRVAQYFCRGVGVSFPQIDPERVASLLEASPNEAVELETMDFTIVLNPLNQQSKKLEPNMWECSLKMKIPRVMNNQASDYGGISPAREAKPNWWFYSALHQAMRHAARAPPFDGRELAPMPFYLQGHYELPADLPCDYQELVSQIVDLLYGPVDGASDHEKIAWTVADMSGAKTINYRRARNITHNRVIVHTLNVDIVDAARIQKRAQDAIRESGDFAQLVNVWPLLEPHIADVLDRVDRMRAGKAPIEWWVRGEPQRQWTASLNPAIVDSDEFFLVKQDEPRPAFLRERDELDATAPSILAEPTVMRVPQVEKIDDEEVDVEDLEPKSVEAIKCCLCLCNMYPGDKNTITLPCGHSMCLMNNEDSGCSGWVTLVRGDNMRVRCPICRDVPSETSEAGSIGDDDDDDDDPMSRLLRTVTFPRHIANVITLTE